MVEIRVPKRQIQIRIHPSEPYDTQRLSRQKQMPQYISLRYNIRMAYLPIIKKVIGKYYFRGGAFIINIINRKQDELSDHYIGWSNQLYVYLY